MRTIRELAGIYVASGLSVIPIKTDGSKAPALASWDEYKKRLPSTQELDQWFVGRKPGLAVIGGTVSGNLGILDFEYQDLFCSWAELVDAIEPGLVESMPQVTTPGKRDMAGRHCYFRATADVPLTTQKLARLNKDEAERRTGDPNKNTSIEMKAEGGYVIAPGSPASCHPSGRLYEHTGGPFLEQVPVLSKEQVHLLLSSARALDMALEEKRNVVTVPELNGTGNRPGDLFNQKASWEEILVPHGWKRVRRIGEKGYWCRPGKEKGISATTGFCKSERSGDLLYVFSTNAEPFQEGRAYSKFTAWGLLEHGGDWKKAAGAAAAQMDRGEATLPAGIVLDPMASPDVNLMDAARANDKKFNQSWLHKRSDLSATIFGYEQSLAFLASRMQWPDQEIVNLIIAHRRKYDPSSLSAMLAGNYLGRLLERAKASLGFGQEAEKTTIANAEVTEAVQSGGDDQRTKVRYALGGVPFKRIIRRGRERPVYAVELEDGSEIILGNNLDDMKHIRRAIRDGTKDVPGGPYCPVRMKGYEWDAYAILIVAISENVDLHDGELCEGFVSLLNAYLEQTTVYEESEWRDALVGRAPFVRQGKIHVNVNALGMYLMNQTTIRMDHAELCRMLSRLGFTGQQESQRVAGKKINRWYWSGKLTYLDAVVDGDQEVCGPSPP